MMKKKKRQPTVLLLSGGLDSATLAVSLRPSLCIFVNYGQPPARQEEASSRKVASSIGAELHVIEVSFWLGAMRTGIDPKGLQVVPHRNSFLLSLAVNQAARVGSEVVWYGATKEDALYPDCHQEWLDEYNRLLRAEGLPITVSAPFITYTKRDVVRLAKKLGLDPTECWSCYAGGDEPCGECKSCQLVLKYTR